VSEFARIVYRHEGAVARVELSDPPSRNALSETMREELLVACDLIDHTPEVRTVILSGAGGDFSSGADLREFGRAASVCSARETRRAHDVYRRVLLLRCPTLALISGVAVGGGLELALACDVRIAVAGCTVGLPEVRRGFIPGGGGTQFAGRRACGRAAHALVLGGELIDDTRARGLGLLHEVHPTAGAASQRADELAGELASLDENEVAYVKRQLLELS
jgi:3-hydroxyacyl-CoA dehydrogenase